MGRRTIGLGALLGRAVQPALDRGALFGQPTCRSAVYPIRPVRLAGPYLPGRLVIGTVETMVKVIVLLRLGAIDTAAKSIEQAQGILFVIVACAVIGAILAWALQSSTGRGWRFGLLAGVVLQAGFTVVELGLNGSRTDVWGGLLWLAILSLAWGGLLGWLIAWPAPGSRRRATRASRHRRPAHCPPGLPGPGGRGRGRGDACGRWIGTSAGSQAGCVGRAGALVPSPTAPATPQAVAGRAATPAGLPAAGAQLPTPAPVPSPSFAGAAPAAKPAEAATTATGSLPSRARARS